MHAAERCVTKPVDRRTATDGTARNRDGPAEQQAPAPDAKCLVECHRVEGSVVPSGCDAGEGTRRGDHDLGTPQSDMRAEFPDCADIRVERGPVEGQVDVVVLADPACSGDGRVNNRRDRLRGRVTLRTLEVTALNSRVVSALRGRGKVQVALANHQTSQSVRARGDVRWVVTHLPEARAGAGNTCPAALFWATAVSVHLHHIVRGQGGVRVTRARAAKNL